MSQISLPLQVAISKEIDGVEMGVLKDGTPYLSARGLARMCGVVPSRVITFGQEWTDGPGRTGKLGKLLLARGIDATKLHVDIVVDGKPTHAYSDKVCLVFLEYYAFEAEIRHRTAEATRAFRALASLSFREFIYRALGYSPASIAVPESWAQFRDRLLLNPVPSGFFSVFKEMSEFVLSCMRAGLTIDHRTVPDISIGKAWSSYWDENNLAAKYGARGKSPHEYPDYFPQSKAGPQDAYVYPVDALGEFRRWMENHYIPEKFPNYLQGQTKKGQIEPANAAKLLNAVAPTAVIAGRKSVPSLPAPAVIPASAPTSLMAKLRRRKPTDEKP